MIENMTLSNIISLAALIISFVAIYYSRKKYKADITPFLCIKHPIQYDDAGKTLTLFLVNNGANLEILDIKSIDNNLQVAYPQYFPNVFFKDGVCLQFIYKGMKTVSTDKYKLKLIYKGIDMKTHQLIITGEKGKFIIR